MIKIKRILIIAIMAIILMNFINILTYEVKAKSYEDMMKEASTFISKGQTQAGSVNISGMTEPFVPLGQILTMIGGGVMVAVTTFMGIKYLTSGPDAQAKLKQQLIGVVVSGIVIFGAYFIWKAVLKIVQLF